MTKTCCDLCRKEIADSTRVNVPMFALTFNWVPAYVATGLKRFSSTEICEDCAKEISRTIIRLKSKADKEE